MTERRNNFWYSATDSSTVFVFVHGIFSDSRGCWRSGDNGQRGGSVYWPDLVAADPRLDGPSIYMAGFHTAADAGDYDLMHAARELLGALTVPDADRNPPPIERETIVFVCHSTGGLVTRYLLERFYYLFQDKNIGLVLIASPALGSVYANRFSGLARLFNQRLGLQLRWLGDSVRELDDRFRDLVDSRRLPVLVGVEAYEARFIGPRWLAWMFRTLFPRVVEPLSAGRYFRAPRLLAETNHFSCVKPTSRDHPAHKLLVEFWVEFKDQIDRNRQDQEPTKRAGREPIQQKRSQAISAGSAPSVPPLQPGYQHRYGHPYYESVNNLVSLANSPTRGQLVTCLGPPGSLKSLLVEDAASQLTEVRRVVWINVSSGTSLDMFETRLKYRSLGKDGKDLAFDDFLYAVPPLLVVVDAFHGYFTDSSEASPEPFRLWPERLRALTTTKPHVVVLCGSLSPQHLYTGYGKRQALRIGSWNLTPNPLRLRPDLPKWYEKLAETTGLAMAEIERLASLAEHHPGVLTAALDAIDFNNPPESAIETAHRSYADEILFASPPCCRELLRTVSHAGDLSSGVVAQECREALTGARFLIDSPAKPHVSVGAWVRRWREVPE